MDFDNAFSSSKANYSDQLSEVNGTNFSLHDSSFTLDQFGLDSPQVQVDRELFPPSPFPLPGIDTLLDGYSFPSSNNSFNSSVSEPLDTCSLPTSCAPNQENIFPLKYSPPKTVPVVNVSVSVNALPDLAVSAPNCKTTTPAFLAPLDHNNSAKEGDETEGRLRTSVCDQNPLPKEIILGNKTNTTDHRLNSPKHRNHHTSEEMAESSFVGFEPLDPNGNSSSASDEAPSVSEHIRMKISARTGCVETTVQSDDSSFVRGSSLANVTSESEISGPAGRDVDKVWVDDECEGEEESEDENDVNHQSMDIDDSTQDVVDNTDNEIGCEEREEVGCGTVSEGIPDEEERTEECEGVDATMEVDGKSSSSKEDMDGMGGESEGEEAKDVSKQSVDIDGRIQRDIGGNNNDTGCEETVEEADTQTMSEDVTSGEGRIEEREALSVEVDGKSSPSKTVTPANKLSETEISPTGSRRRKQKLVAKSDIYCETDDSMLGFKGDIDEHLDVEDGDGLDRTTDGASVSEDTPMKSAEHTDDGDGEFDFEITVNDHDDGESDHGDGNGINTSAADKNSEPPSSGETKTSKRKKKPVRRQSFESGDIKSDDDQERPSWEVDPKTLFAGMALPEGPKALKLKEPFQYGWAREIVVRYKYDSLKSAGRPPMDVYYFNPEGKKLRSAVQISDYLSSSKDDNGLTMENFSFNRCPVHKEPFETIRMANTGRSVGSVRGHKKRKRLSGRKSPIAKKVLYKPSPKVEVEEKDWETQLRPVSPPKPKQKARKSFRPMEIPKRLLSPLEQSMPDPKRLKVKASGGSSTPVNHVGKKGKEEFRLCTLDCPGRRGIPPSLHCSVCMCLFHPACVEYSEDDPSQWTCQRCCKQPLAGDSAPMSKSTNFGSVNEVTTTTITLLKTKVTPAVYGIASGEPDIVQTDFATGEMKADNESVPFQDEMEPGKVPPLPRLRPMTVAAHLKAMQQDTDDKKKTVVSWNLSDSKGKYPTIIPAPPPLRNVRPAVTSPQNVGSIPSVVPSMPSLSKGPRHMAQSPQHPSNSRNVIHSSVGNSMPQNATVNFSNAASRIVGSTVSSGGLPDPRMAGQLLTLPGNIMTKLKMNEPLALKINNQSLVVNPDCFVNTSQGMKIFLPPNTLPVHSGNKTINISIPQTTVSAAAPVTTSGMSGDKTSLVSSDQTTNLPTWMNRVVSHICADERNAVKTSSVDGSWRKDSSADDNSVENVSDSQTLNTSKKKSPASFDSVVHKKKTFRQCKGTNPTLCYIGVLHGGYDCLMEIFRYLSVRDLLTACEVCKSWQKIITQPCLWKSVKLKDSYVTDWSAAMVFLKKVHTRKLDLRGMKHLDDRNRTWHHIVGVLNQMVGLQEIYFGQCTASILHAVTDKLVNLKVLTAEWITDIFEEPQMWTTNTKLDIGKFSKLTQLEELRLRGVCGLVMPSFSFSGGLQELGSLQNLKTLSLTTVKDMSCKELNFLAKLTNLTLLEIGDCSSWTVESYSVLEKLENLRVLRLENGGELEDTGLCTALPCFKCLVTLELVMFIIPNALGEALFELEKLEHLSVWPDPRGQAAVVNTNAFNAVKNLKQLRTLDWGVVTREMSEIEDKQDSGMIELFKCLETTSHSRNDVIIPQLGHEEENMPREIEKISTQDLHDRLASHLLATKITVNDVAVLSSQRGRPNSSS